MVSVLEQFSYDPRNELISSQELDRPERHSDELPGDDFLKFIWNFPTRATLSVELEGLLCVLEDKLSLLVL